MTILFYLIGVILAWFLAAVYNDFIYDKWDETKQKGWEMYPIGICILSFFAVFMSTCMITCALLRNLRVDINSIPTFKKRKDVENN